jgi:DNA-damage-inducible protein J
MPTIQVRIDENTKKSAKKVLDKIGMDMSSAVKVYLKQIVITQGLPFQLLTENGLTVQQEQAILKASEEAKKGINVSGPFATAKETQDYLDSLK